MQLQLTAVFEKVREGYMKSMLPLTLPFIPGWDVSGTVEATGPGATRFKKGDAVYGNPSPARNGAYAEFITVKESEIVAKPASIDYIQAAGVPVVASTAWQSLFDVAGLTSGQRILIHAASGGVGGSAVQLAKWKGAQVIGTTSPANLDFVREDLLEIQFQLAVPGQQVILVAIKEAVAPHQLKSKMQVSPDVLDVGLAAMREGKFLVDLFFELGKDGIDDIVFIAEVVIQVAWGDVHLFGDHRRRDIRLAEFIE